MKNEDIQAVAALVALGTVVAPAIAQEQSTPEELYVIGQRLEETTPQQLAKLGNRLEVLTADQLKLGGFDDLSQALQMDTPGLYVAPKSGAFDYINCSLQGSRCEDILWLVDGIRTANRLYNTTTPLDTIPANMIERVEVLYGGQGIFYGTQSVAGVVNVVTKSFSDEPTGSVNVGLDDNSGTHLAGDYRTAFGGHQLALFASKDEADGFQPFPTEDYQPSATDRERGYDVLSFGVKYAYDFNDRSRLSLMYQRTDATLDFLRPMWTAEGVNDRVDDWITAKWDYAASDNVDLYVKAYWHDWDTNFTEVWNDIGPGGVLTGTQTVVSDNLFWGFEDYGVTAVAEIRSPGSFEYAVGYDYQRFWGEDEVWLIEDKTETVNALYGQIRTTREQLENTSLAFGARYNDTSGTFSGTVWNFSGQHDFSDSLYLRGQIGTAFRLPDAEELYLRDCCEQGNPNLEPEESENVEVGIGGQAAGRGDVSLSWQLIAFRRDIDNLITIGAPTPAFPDGRFENIEDAVEQDGWEAVLNIGFGEAMSLWFDYVSTNAETKSDGAPIQDIPESMFKIGFSYRTEAKPLELNVAIVNVGDVFDQVAGVGRVDHGDYTVVDLGMGYYFDAERRNRIGIRLENAFDEEYTTAIARGRRDIDNSSYAARYLGMPRTVHATYTHRF